MPTQFNLNRDQGGIPSYSPYFAVDKYNTTLAASVAQNVTVPNTNSVWCAIFTSEPGSSIWVAKNATATLPGGSFASTYSEQNPQSRFVNGGDVLSFITASASAEIGVILYAVSA